MASILSVKTTAPPKPALSAEWPSQDKWKDFIRDSRAEVRRLVDLHLDGFLDADELHPLLKQQLVNYHAQAAALGRARAGLVTGVTAADMRMAQLVMQEEAEFLDGLIYELRRGDRYVDPATGEVARDVIQARAQSYSGRFLGTANEAFIAVTPEGMMFDWVLGAVEHCYLCPEIAAGSPYTYKELPAVPGGNLTPCLFNCKCYLRRSDGVTGFRRT